VTLALDKLQHQVGSLSNASVTPSASSNGQLLVGSNVFNFAGSSMPLIPCSSRSFTGFSSSPISAMPHSTMSNSESSSKPFVLKMKTNQIRVCQSCRKDYNGPNDTMGLLVARAERRLVSNLHTGTEFLGRESNSHYHLHMECLKRAQPSFSGDQLVISQVAFERRACVPCLGMQSQLIVLRSPFHLASQLLKQALGVQSTIGLADLLPNELKDYMWNCDKTGLCSAQACHKILAKLQGVGEDVSASCQAPHSQSSSVADL